MLLPIVRQGCPLFRGFLIPLLCLSLIPLPSARAASGEADSGITLDLAAAVQRTLERNPGLAVAREEIAVADARVRGAGLRPAFELAAEFENFAGNGDLDGADALESTLSLSRVLEMGDKRRLRTAAATLERESAKAALTLAQVDAAARTAELFLEALHAQERAATAAEGVALAEKAVVQARRRVEAGLALRAEVLRGSAEAGRRRIQEFRARSEAASARARLAASWGMSAPDFDAVSGDLLALRRDGDLAGRLERLEQSPLLAQLLTMERLREAELRLAAAQARPDVGISAGLRHLNDSDDMALVAGFSVPLGSRSRSAAAQAEAEARLRQARAETAAGKAEVRGALSRLQAEITARREAIQILTSEVLPAAETALTQVERGYQLGRLSYTEYAASAAELLEARLELLDEAVAYQQLTNELDRLLGAGVGGL